MAAQPFAWRFTAPLHLGSALNPINSSMIAMALVPIATDLPTMAIASLSIVFGIALGAAASGNQVAFYLQAEPDQLGVASGLFRTFGYLGSIAAAAVTGTVFHTRVSDHGMRLIATAMVTASVAAIALSVFDGPRNRPSRDPLAWAVRIAASAGSGGRSS